jgi:hypothetical protein
MDSNGNGTLDFEEFTKACVDFRIKCSEDEIRSVFSVFDVNGDGSISFEEFMNALLGPLSEYRVRLIAEAFKKLDENGNGSLEIGEVKEKFDPSRHPEVKSGQKSVEEARYEFYDLFQTHHGVANDFRPDKGVSMEEFLQYHQFVSALIDNDGYFKLFIVGVWNMDLVDTNQANSPVKIAGKHPDIYGKNAKENWKMDMHKSLFGKLDPSPMKNHVDDQRAKRQNEYNKPEVENGMTAAGVGNWKNLNKAGNIQAEKDIPTY